MRFCDVSTNYNIKIYCFGANIKELQFEKLAYSFLTSRPVKEIIHPNMFLTAALQVLLFFFLQVRRVCVTLSSVTAQQRPLLSSCEGCSRPRLLITRLPVRSV